MDPARPDGLAFLMDAQSGEATYTMNSLDHSTSAEYAAD
jgi:hypothetical protein